MLAGTQPGQESVHEKILDSLRIMTAQVNAHLVMQAHASKAGYFPH
jgi:hypothetical protein